MAHDFFAASSLRLDPRFVRRQVLAIALHGLWTLPGIALLIHSGALVLPSLLVLFGAAPSLLAYRRYRGYRRIAEAPHELHLPITARLEGSEWITYDYRLPSAPDSAREGPVEQVQLGVDAGSPLFADSRGESLVALVPRGRPGPQLVPRADLYPLLLDPDTRATVRHRQIEERLRFSFGRGFKNLDVVAWSLRMLLLAEAEGRLPPRPSKPWDGHDAYDPDDALMSAQRLARELTRAFGFDAGPIVVQFHERLEAAAQVEYEPNTGFFVEVRKEYAARPVEMAAILAHEVAHVFLGVHRLAPDNRFDNEIATDMAAALWGFGHVMIESYRSEHLDGHVRKLTHLGYLTPDEIAYVMAKQMDTRPLQKRAPHHAHRAYRMGRARAWLESRTPPLASSGLARRALYATRRALAGSGRERFAGATTETGGYRLQENHVVFRCPSCTQHIRLPVRKAGTASCPNCRAKLPFAS